MTRGSRLQPLARAVLRTQSDERLVALSREGRDAAFEEIVRRYRPGLVAFAAAYAPPDRAEDVVQESLVSSWDALRRSTEEIRLKPWLYTIVRNRALNARRDARPHGPLTDDLDGVRQPDEVALSNEELARVVSAVNALPDAQREALVRSAIEGHTHEQIAAALGSSPGAVRQLIYRGRLAVRGGVGLVIPLPLVRALADSGAGEAAAAAVAGGAAAAGAGGASGLTKATVVAVVGTIAIGSGAAIKRSADQRGEAAPSAQSSGAQPADSPSGAGRGDEHTSPQSSSGESPDGGHGGGSGGDEGGEDRGQDDDRDGPDRDDREDDHSAPGRGGDDEDDGDDQDVDDHGGSSGPDDDSPSSGTGHGPSGDDPPAADEDTGGHSGGSGGSGSSGSSGSGGSGPGEDGSDDDSEVEPPDDSGPSGESGSGESGSGSSGSGSSGSGGGADHDLDDQPTDD